VVPLEDLVEDDPVEEPAQSQTEDDPGLDERFRAPWKSEPRRLSILGPWIRRLSFLVP
jgi:hypothetical protein